LREQVILPGKSLLNPPVFYYSNEISRDRLVHLIHEASYSRVNCIYSAETRPPAGMLAEAHKRRDEQKLNEPMFRTLLRIRKEWIGKGLL